MALPLTPADVQTATEVVSFFGPSQQVWAAGLIFLRIGAVVMLLPGLGDQAVPPRMRLGFSLIFSLMMLPILGPQIPPLPASVGEAGGLVILELLIGLMMGSLIRVFIAALAVAGEILSLSTTLSFSQTANPMQAQPGTTLATFLALLGLVLIYATGLHHLFIEGIVDSYQIFTPGAAIKVGDAVTMMIRTVSQTFMVAIQISAPVIAFSLIFNIATGFIGRIMPNFPIFFASSPLSVLLGLSVFAIGLGVSGTMFLTHYRDFLSFFIRPE